MLPEPRGGRTGSGGLATWRFAAPLKSTFIAIVRQDSQRESGTFQHFMNHRTSTFIPKRTMSAMCPWRSSFWWRTCASKLMETWFEMCHEWKRSLCTCVVSENDDDDDDDGNTSIQTKTSWFTLTTCGKQTRVSFFLSQLINWSFAMSQFQVWFTLLLRRPQTFFYFWKIASLTQWTLLAYPPTNLFNVLSGGFELD